MGKGTKTERYKKFIPETEEIRCWFKVSSNRKMVWNIQLWLLEELKKICKKHNIKYYADAGTLLWTIRHEWYIPWDDDVDIGMLREDYEKFLKIAEKELPDNIKLWEYHRWFTKLVNINTTALWEEDNWWDKDFVWGIRIDIFPIDYASKYAFINRIKSKLLGFLVLILLAQKSHWVFDNAKWNKVILDAIKFISKKVDYLKVRQLFENINKKVFFKWKNVYIGFFYNRFLHKEIYDKSHDVKFENTTICIPDWYDNYLKTVYGNYMKPIIRSWWHNCRYSVDKSFKDIIKTFDKFKTNEENYKNCNNLFIL